MVLLMVGCKKKTTKIETPMPDETVEEVDTSFKEPETFDIDTSDEVVFSEAELEAEFRRKVDAIMTPIYFEFNSFALSGEAMSRLGDIGSFMNEYSSMRVLIEGHCDERGSSEYNMGLGENRARVVKDYLVNYGIAPIRIEITSYGKERPAQPYCTTEACHSENRRAEFKVLSK
jgi:peptidoglycan-associated lipoprotein